MLKNQLLNRLVLVGSVFNLGADGLSYKLPDHSPVVAEQQRNELLDREDEGICDFSALQDASKKYFDGEIEALNGNPCVEPQELQNEHSDRWDLKDHRSKFNNFTGKCTEIKLPRMVYLGQGHTGSTTLAMQLDAHPELSYGSVKEHHWGERVFSGNGHLDDYSKQFEVPCRVKMTMDFSPGEYLDGHHGSHWKAWSQRNQWLPWLPKENNSAIVDPRIMKNLLGKDTKLIVMLRDPVDFLDSLPTWWRSHAEEAHADCYAQGLQRWMDVFPKKNILVIQAESYFADAQASLDEIFEFLGVSKWTYPAQTPHSGRRRNTHTSSLVDRRDYHSKTYNKECKQQLEELTGRTFSWPGSELQ